MPATLPIHRKKSRHAPVGLEKGLQAPFIEATRRPSAESVRACFGFTPPSKTLERRHDEKLSFERERAVWKLDFVTGEQ
jgi:hypothetical protein